MKYFLMKYLLTLFFVVLVFEVRAHTLSHSTALSPF
jgi:hypothetical protein